MDLAEAAEIVKDFNQKHPERVNGLLESLWALLKAHARSIPDIGNAKYKSWAELDWAGKIVDGHREKVEAEKDFIAAVFALAQDATSVIGKEIFDV